MIGVNLTAEQAEMLKVFTDNWEDIKKLWQGGLFELKNGRFIIDKDEQGKIKHTQITKDKRWE